MSSSTYSDIGGSPRGPESDKCAEVYSNLQIFSPVSSVLKSIKVGDKLTFEIVDKDGKPSLEVLLNGTKAGAVIHPQLTKCIESGVQYEGQVKSIDHGLCLLDAVKI